MTQTDTLPGREFDFGISKINEAWIMRSLADLYSNRELAVIREYSTNARDAMVEAGRSDAPIEVTLPDTLNPFFTVKDTGVGMTEEEMEFVFAQFGESPKRDSDDYNGILGFGCKSAVAYTNTFTVESVKRGYKTTLVVTRTEDQMGGYSIKGKIVLSVPTNEHNGTTVTIPVHNWREFEQKARDFYRFWLPGTVLVNGSQPEWAVGEKIDDNLYYNPRRGTSYVVMGNVPYRIANPDALFPSGMNKISFVAYVPNGSVEFTPNREDLKYSDHTKNNLHKVINDFIAKSVAKAKAEISAAKTHSEAYTAWTTWRNTIGAGQVADLEFKGDKLVEEFDINAQRYERSAYRYSTWAIDKWTVGNMSRTIIVSEFDPQQLTATHKRKAREWADDKGISATWFLFTAADFSNPWIDPARIVTWDRLKAEAPKPVKQPRAAVSWGRKAGTFDLVSATGVSSEQDVPNTKPLYYVSVKDYNNVRENGHNFAGLLKSFGIKEDVVKVPANRRDKFLRSYPHAKDILAHLKSQVKTDGPSLLSADAKTVLGMHNSDRRALQRMDAKRVDDPELVHLIGLASKSEYEYLEEYNRQHMLARALRLRFTEHPYTYWAAKGNPLSDKYPLAVYAYNISDKRAFEHLYLYINSAYKAQKEGKNV